MKEILIACGDTDLLRTLVGDLPPDQFKPIATRRGAGIVAKLGGRSLSLAIVHADLEDGAAQQLLAELRAFDAQLLILYLSAQKLSAVSSSHSGKQPGEQTLFDTALQYPLPGPVFRNAVRRLTEDQDKTHDLEKWRTFYNEVKQRLEAQPTQNYYAILSVPDDAPHHVLVTAFDAPSRKIFPTSPKSNFTFLPGTTALPSLKRLRISSYVIRGSSGLPPVAPYTPARARPQG